MAFRFEPLSGSHDRRSFASRSDALNTYLQTLALKDVGRRVSAAFVMVDEVAPATIIGFYTLSAFTIELADLPDSLKKRLPRYPAVPATLLGRLARDERFPGTGSLLLMNALERAFRQTAQIASVEWSPMRRTLTHSHFIGNSASRTWVAAQTASSCLWERSADC